MTFPEVYQSARPRLESPPVSITQVYIDTDRGSIQIEMAVIDAPLTVENFVTLARKGPLQRPHRDHRVVPTFVVQDGDPRGDGEGGPGYTIRDELQRAVRICAARSGWRSTGRTPAAVSSSSRTLPQPHPRREVPLVFGRVIAGMEVVDPDSTGRCDPAGEGLQDDSATPAVDDEIRK